MIQSSDGTTPFCLLHLIDTCPGSADLLIVITQHIDNDNCMVVINIQ